MADIHWFAGLYEGEGYCRRTTSEHIVVSMTDMEPIKRVQELFGGSIHPWDLSAQGWKTEYRWAASGARARGILMTIYPLLAPRRQAQIRKALKP